MSLDNCLFIHPATDNVCCMPPGIIWDLRSLGHHLEPLLSFVAVPSSQISTLLQSPSFYGVRPFYSRLRMLLENPREVPEVRRRVWGRARTSSISEAFSVSKSLRCQSSQSFHDDLLQRSVLCSPEPFWALTGVGAGNLHVPLQGLASFSGAHIAGALVARDSRDILISTQGIREQDARDEGGAFLELQELVGDISTPGIEKSL